MNRMSNKVFVTLFQMGSLAFLRTWWCNCMSKTNTASRDVSAHSREWVLHGYAKFWCLSFQPIEMNRMSNKVFVTLFQMVLLAFSRTWWCNCMSKTNTASRDVSAHSREWVLHGYAKCLRALVFQPIEMNRMSNKVFVTLFQMGSLAFPRTWWCNCMSKTNTASRDVSAHSREWVLHGYAKF